MTLRIHIRHDTTYRYRTPVQLGQQLIRLHPRPDGGLRIRRGGLVIRPRPAGCAEGLDAEGNVVTQAWFWDPVEELHIRSAWEVDTLRDNPFDFLVTEPDVLRLPARYPVRMAATLASSCSVPPPAGPVAALADEVASRTQRHTLDFLSALALTLYENLKQERRETGDPLSPEETLARGGGACRDLAVLFMAACRSQGLAARFVSGYWLAGPEQGPPALHAWAEVFLPGAGWRGFDPSVGLAVAEHHVPVAAAAAPAEAAAVSGAFWGKEAGGTLETRLDIRGE